MASKKNAPAPVPLMGLRKARSSGGSAISALLDPLVEAQAAGEHPDHAVVSEPAPTLTKAVPHKAAATPATSTVATSRTAEVPADASSMMQVNTNLPAAVRRGLRRAKVSTGKNVEALLVELGEKWIRDGGFAALGAIPVDMDDKARFTTRFPATLGTKLELDAAEAEIKWNELITRAYAHWTEEDQQTDGSNQ